MIDIQITTVSDPKYQVSTTEVLLKVRYFDDKFPGKPTHYYDIEGVGASRCAEDDRFSVAIGEQLATARALKDAARQLEREARDEVAAHERVRLSQEEARRRRIDEREARKPGVIQESLRAAKAEAQGDK